MNTARPAHAPITPRLRGHARAMRRDMTSAETRFWYAVRARRFQGLLFRRQVPIAGYACHERRLIVEIDGATDGTDSERRSDSVRTRRLEREGYRVLRFWNDDIRRKLPAVLHRIHQELDTGGSASGH
ncbi:MAG: endonuclease domain-containing protein [Bauldia sp.]|uniref:endonuclease domain-containing protein n=1 Tax=Bauldia sp. TaxID=2575872 RepID=UPI001DDD64D4|nr:DUF559 domain-containing protein [Bauldia sp.]MCB1498048.1 endonuclease domain-containing protein [Bauldia sp.]